MAFFEIGKVSGRMVADRFPNQQVSFEQGHVTPELAKKYSNCNVLSTKVRTRLDASILDLLPNLSLICTRSTGFDHIDLEYCAKRKITVCNVPAYGDDTVAEYTMSLILAASRKIVVGSMRTKNLDLSLDGLRGFDLKGKTMGVIGTGRIGMAVIKIANGLGMNVIAFDLYPQENLQEQFTYAATLDEIFAKSDVMSIHLPLNPQTKHLVNLKNVSTLKRGCLLVNTSRGEVVETEAVLYGLENGILRGACLDVFEDEAQFKNDSGLLKDSEGEFAGAAQVIRKLLSRDDVIITSHNAFNSDEAVEWITSATIENIESFFAGKPKNTLKPKGLATAI